MICFTFVSLIPAKESTHTSNIPPFFLNSLILEDRCETVPSKTNTLCIFEPANANFKSFSIFFY